MIINETLIRVRYAETDKMGVVHHATYPLYYEAGRTELLRDLGLSYREMEDNGFMMPLIDLQCVYKASAYYDEVLTVRTILKHIPGIKVKFEYEIENQQKQLINTGSTTLVIVDATTMRPVRPPKSFLALFEPHFQL